MVIGLGVDVGHAFLVRRQLTSIADDAVLSGSQAIDIPELHAGHLELEPSQARDDAMRTITANPLTTGQATATTVKRAGGRAGVDRAKRGAGEKSN